MRTLFMHECRRGWKALFWWTVILAGTLAVCVAMYREIAGQMAAVNALFSTLGMFTQAFGLDRLNLGTLMGYYGVECGTVLGLGGGCYAALTGICAISGEEAGHTAEFLHTHPIGRRQVMVAKIGAAFCGVVLLNTAITLSAAAAMVLIGQDVPWRELLLLHGALMGTHMVLLLLCLGLSAFLHVSNAGLGLGLAVGFYFLNLLGNLAPSAGWLKWFTPYGFSEPAEVLTSGCVSIAKLSVYGIVALGVAAAGLWHYGRRDIRA